MEVFDEIRNAAKEFLSEENRTEIQSQLSKILRSQPNDALTIAFCGTFSSGKSSLINELLQSQFKLPVGATPVTKFVTRLKYAKNPTACYMWHGEEYPLSLSDLNEILTGKLPLPDESLEVVIKLPSKILRGGIELLDTPGFLDNEELTKLTRDAVSTADIAIFCCHATAAGKKFETDYFQELEETIGNFLVVINHKDSINTDEDFKKITSFMEGNIANRGLVILQFLITEKLFYTSAGGTYVDLGEFKNFFSFLCIGLTKKFRSRLQRYAYQKRTIHALQILSNEAQAQIHCGDYFYLCADNAMGVTYQKTRKKFLEECKRNSKTLENILDTGQKLLDTVIVDIEREFDSLESREHVLKFSDSATSYLRNKLHALTNILREHLKKKFPLNNFDDDKFLAEYTSTVNKYSVPMPVGRRVEKGGVINFLSSIFGSSSRTDNYETIYENYAADAKIHLREKLYEKLQAAIIKYFRLLESALKPVAPSKEVAFLEELTACKRKWEIINADISKYLNFCHENFICAVSDDRKLFPILPMAR